MGRVGNIELLQNIPTSVITSACSTDMFVYAVFNSLKPVRGHQSQR